MVTPQFVSVGGADTIALDALKPVGSGVDTEGGVNIQVLDAYGVTVNQYLWIDWSADDDIVGWCDGSFNLVKNVTFGPGQGLWVQGTSTDAAVQSVGKVGSSDVTVQLRKGATATGNPFPVAISLQDIVPTGTDVDTEGGVNIQVLDAYGVTVNQYLWIDWSADDDIVGWCDGSFNLVENVTFEPGQGLWVQGTSSDAYLRFPAPQL